MKLSNMFFSCSVIVDELARWKVNLLQRQEDVDRHVRLLLHERAILWDTLNSSADTLANIKAAFDPLGTQVCKAFRVGGPGSPVFGTIETIVCF